MDLSRIGGLVVGCVLFLVASVACAELILNGDFEAGNTDFGSDYTFTASNGDSGTPEGEYTVGDDPSTWNGNYINPVSADLPAGNTMLIANGSDSIWDRVWYQSIPVVAGTTYDVSFLAASVFPTEPATLRFYVGTDPNDPFAFAPVTTLALTSDTGAGAWTEATGQFTAAESGDVLAFITDLITAPQGNDFAIDNISVEVVPEPSSLALLSVASLLGFVLFARRRRKAG